MRDYIFRALNAQGHLIRGELRAPSRQQACRQLCATYKDVLSVKPRWMTFWGGGVRTSLFQKGLFFQQLENLSLAGITLRESLEMMCVDSPRVLQRVAQRCRNHLEEGKGVGEVFETACRPHKAMITLLKIAEKTGDLGQALGQVRRYFEHLHFVQYQWHKAIRYPLSVLLVLMGTTGVLCSCVLPDLLSFVQQIEGELNGATRFLMCVSQITAQQGLCCGGLGVGICLALLCIWRASRRGRLLIERLILGLPFGGTLCLSVTWAQFFHLWGLLSRAAVPLSQALEQIVESVFWMHLSFGLEKGRQRILAGETISDAFRRLPGITPATLSLLQVGEKTGDMAQALHSIAGLYERRAQAQQEKLLRLFEPVCVGILGAMLGVLVGGTLLPLYQQLSLPEGGLG